MNGLFKNLNESTHNQGIFVRDTKGRHLHITTEDLRKFNSGKDVYATDEDGEEYEVNKKFVDVVESEVNEGRQQIKRKYGDYSAIRVNEKTPVRNKVIEFVGKRFVTEEELITFLTQLTEERGKDLNKKQWFDRNEKYFESFTNRGQKVMTLSKYGKRILDGIVNPSKNKQMVTESIGLFKSELFESLNESTKFQGKDILPNWLSSRDFGSLVKSTRDLEPGKFYIILDPGMNEWQGEMIYQGKTGNKYIFNPTSQFEEPDTMEFTEKELMDVIKSKEIYEQL